MKNTCASCQHARPAPAQYGRFIRCEHPTSPIQFSRIEPWFGCVLYEVVKEGSLQFESTRRLLAEE